MKTPIGDMHIGNIITISKQMWLNLCSSQLNTKSYGYIIPDKPHLLLAPILYEKNENVSVELCVNLDILKNKVTSEMRDIVDQLELFHPDFFKGVRIVHLETETTVHFNLCRTLNENLLYAYALLTFELDYMPSVQEVLFDTYSEK